jgi:hypothetical protein
MCPLLVEQVLTVLGWQGSQATDPVAVLLAYITFYDQRGGGIETALNGDKQGPGSLGLTKRNKKRFDARHMLVLLGSLAHNVVVWARQWLAIAEGSYYGVICMVRDIFYISGFLGFDVFHHLAEIVLNQQPCRAHKLVIPLHEQLVPCIYIKTPFILSAPIVKVAMKMGQGHRLFSVLLHPYAIGITNYKEKVPPS